MDCGHVVPPAQNPLGRQLALAPLLQSACGGTESRSVSHTRYLWRAGLSSGSHALLHLSATSVHKRVQLAKIELYSLALLMASMFFQLFFSCCHQVFRDIFFSGRANSSATRCGSNSACMAALCSALCSTTASHFCLRYWAQSKECRVALKIVPLRSFIYPFSGLYLALS